MSLQLHSLQVAQVKPVTAEAHSLSFVIPTKLRKQYQFAPGQYLTLAANLNGGEVRRTYSIHTAQGESPEVLVKQVAGGAFSGYVRSGLRSGDRLQVMTPAGSFGAGLDYAKPGNYLFAAAGSGITPVISILQSVLAGSEHSRATLLYGNRGADTVIFFERLQDMKDRYLERLQLVHVLSRDKPDTELLAGRLDRAKFAELFKLIGAPERFTHFLVCGPDGMADAFVAELGSKGVAAADVHRERFNAPATAPKRRRRRATAGSAATEVGIVLDGVRRTISCSAEQSILDAAQQAGLKVPYSCTGGVCSTCRALLLEGKVDMDVNYALTEQELQRGVVLTCQARPRTAQAVVDYDAVWSA